MKLTDNDIMGVLRLGPRVAFSAPPRSGKTTAMLRLVTNLRAMNPVYFHYDKNDALQNQVGSFLGPSRIFGLYDGLAPNISGAKLVVIDDAYKNWDYYTIKSYRNMLDARIKEIQSLVSVDTQIVLSDTRRGADDVFANLDNSWKIKNFEADELDPDYFGIKGLMGSRIWDLMYKGKP